MHRDGRPRPAIRCRRPHAARWRSPRIREEADRKLGVRRDGPELRTLAAGLAAAADPAAGRAATLVAWLVALAADRRTESRGGHYRVDFPRADPAWAHRQAVDADGWWLASSGGGLSP